MTASDLHAPRLACRACGGTGTVLDIEGNQRPCSRCNFQGFDRWVRSRAPAKVLATPAGRSAS